MKQLALFISFIICINVSYGQFDSLKILQQHTILGNNISRYTNQPFSVLYNALKIKPVVLTGFTPFTNRFVENASQFHYANPNDPKYVEFYVYVEWETPIPTSETLQYQDKIRRNFDAREYGIYADKIVKMIRFFPEPKVDGDVLLMKKKPEKARKK